VFFGERISNLTSINPTPVATVQRANLAPKFVFKSPGKGPFRGAFSTVLNRDAADGTAIEQTFWLPAERY
jgi:hypothetical protein